LRSWCRNGFKAYDNSAVGASLSDIAILALPTTVPKLMPISVVQHCSAKGMSRGAQILFGVRDTQQSLALNGSEVWPVFCDWCLDSLKGLLDAVDDSVL